VPLAFGLRVFAELCHEARELLVGLRELLTAVLRELDSLLHEARELVYIGAFALDAADDLVETACSFLIVVCLCVGATEMMAGDTCVYGIQSGTLSP